MSQRVLLPVLLAAVLNAGAAQAQTYDPAASQARLNQMQLDLQSSQLQQLQRRNDQALQQGDPQAAANRLQLQHQADQLDALRQQAPVSSPSSITAQLQASGAAIEQLRTLPPPDGR